MIDAGVPRSVADFTNPPRAARTGYAMPDPTPPPAAEETGDFGEPLPNQEQPQPAQQQSRGPHIPYWWWWHHPVAASAAMGLSGSAPWWVPHAAAGIESSIGAPAAAGLAGLGLSPAFFYTQTGRRVLQRLMQNPQIMRYISQLAATQAGQGVGGAGE